jgi:hypothetical protein
MVDRQRISCGPLESMDDQMRAEIERRSRAAAGGYWARR